MKAQELINLCSNCVRLIEAAQACGIDVIETVERRLIEAIQAGNVTIETSQGFATVPAMISQEVDVAVRIGKLDAVKMYKNRTGLSLMESKQAVEKFIYSNGYKFFKQSY
jgi:ribosomal protein L7/L12